jgi:hypothetical protein
MDTTLPNSDSRISRRSLLRGAGVAVALSLSNAAHSADRDPVGRRPRVAAIFTELRFRSHAYNILENFLGPYYFSGRLIDPGVDVVAMYADQFPGNDMARDVSRRFGIPLFKSIDKALCLGGEKLAVDAVLSIAEHGDYPFNERGQQMYPRKQFFDEAFSVMKRSGRYVPFFNDKHLSYRWDWSKEMYDAARAAKMPLLAGSSVPLAQRIPPFVLPQDADIEEAISIHGGGLESYDFHGLEVLQSLVECRKGGETGIASIELLTGKEYERAKKADRWSEELVSAAMQAEREMRVRRQAFPSVGKRLPTRNSNPTTPGGRPVRPDGPHAIVVTYQDGLKATVLKVGGSPDRWNFACRLRGESKVRSTALFNSPWGNRGLFKALSHAIQFMFLHGQEPYPAERTLLTTGAVEAAMRSYEQGGGKIETPHLEIAYRTNDWRAMRETGATWKIITADVPQPKGFSPRSYEELNWQR